MMNFIRGSYSQIQNPYKQELRLRCFLNSWIFRFVLHFFDKLLFQFKLFVTLKVSLWSRVGIDLWYQEFGKRTKFCSLFCVIQISHRLFVQYFSTGLDNLFNDNYSCSEKSEENLITPNIFSNIYPVHLMTDNPHFGRWIAYRRSYLKSWNNPLWTCNLIWKTYLVLQSIPVILLNKEICWIQFQLLHMK